MKVAVTYENGQVFQHFGHTAQFKIYNIENGKILSSEIMDTRGSGHGALAGVLSELHVDVLICGGIGSGAQMALAEAGIQLVGGVKGEADQAAESFAAGKLAYDPHVKCGHHEHRHDGEHACGDHVCDHHSGSGNSSR